MRTTLSTTTFALLGALATLPFGAVMAQSAPVAPQPTLEDPQIAHIAVTANTVDIELARFAEQRAQDPRVRDFTVAMIAGHTAVNAQAVALARRLGVVPQDNPLSQGLRRGASAAREQLDPLAGASFDRAYMDREVTYHGAVLQVLDQRLIPSSRNEELRALLEQVRPVIAAHLAHAREIAGALHPHQD